MNSTNEQKKSDPEGLEHPRQNRKKTADSDSSCAESDARQDLSPNIPPELADLIDAWVRLPAPVRRGILAMTEAAKR